MTPPDHWPLRTASGHGLPTSGPAPAGAPKGHGCTICKDPDCLGDVDLSLVAGGVPSGKDPKRAMKQAEQIMRSIGGNPTQGSCGSDAGHRQHLRRGETPCPACKEAHAQTMRERRRAA